MSPQFTFCRHWIMSSGTVCTGSPPALSSNCHSRCWGELEGTRRCRVGFGGMFGRGREMRPCLEEDYSCMGSGGRRHWRWGPGWGPGSELGSELGWGAGSGRTRSAPQTSPSTRSGLQDGCCCCCCGGGWRPSPAASGDGFEGPWGHPGSLVCLGSWRMFGGVWRSRGTGGRLGCSRHGSPSCCFWLLWNTPWGRSSCSAACWQQHLLVPKKSDVLETITGALTAPCIPTGRLH